jgi:hypothetical protein
MAGVIAALAVHTNITLVNFLPALAFVHIQAVRHRAAESISARGVVARVGWVASGAVLVTTLLGLVNWSVGREFVFFGPLVRIVLRYLGDPGQQQAFHQPWSSGWLWGAWSLSLTAAVFLAGIISLAFDRRMAADDSRRIANALVTQFLVMTMVWIAWQSAGQTALDVDYFAYALVPSCFMALGGILYRDWPESCEQHWLVTLLGTTAILVLSFTVADIPGLSTFGRLIAPSVFVGGCALFLAPLALHAWRPSIVSVLLFAIAFAFGNRAFSPFFRDYLASDPCKVQPAVYGAIVEGATWLMKVDPLYTRLYTWFDDTELLNPKEGCTVQLGHMGNSMTTMASVAYVAKAFPLPSVDGVPDASVLALAEGGRMLAIISNRPAYLEEWKRRLDGLGLFGEEIDRRTIRVIGSEFTMYALNVRRRSP